MSKRKEINLETLPADPGLRPPIWSYNADQKDRVRRAYLEKGPCQPKCHDFKQTGEGNRRRRFVASWFNEYPNWLECSVNKDRAYCLYCYLFKEKSAKGGGDAFVGEGFQNWQKKVKFDIHVGESNSSHNKARNKCIDLMNQKLTASIASLFSAKKNKDRAEYRIRLNAAVSCVRFLLRQGLAFRGHDESESSNNRGNYLELFHFLADHNEEICNATFDNAPQNCILNSSYIQKDICMAAAAETTRAILNDIGGTFFTILVDESRDVSVKEQMAVVVRYVNKEGCIIERFLEVVHVPNTTAASLKKCIDDLLSKHNLSISRLRGQGYDGANNMRGELKGLKTLILRENSSAHYVHCFAHQLQLGLVAVAKSHAEVQKLFEMTLRVMNVVGASAQRQDVLKAKQYEIVMADLEKGNIIAGRGLNQEINLQRPGDTRWSSHYISLIRLTKMFSAVVEVLEIMEEDNANPDYRLDASTLLQTLQSFEFVFTLHLMKEVLGITNELTLALQRKEQDIENAMSLVNVSKQRLQSLRDDGWDNLMTEISLFCSKHGMVVPNMSEIFVPTGRLKRKSHDKTNLVYYRIELFYVVLDKQLMELNNRFSETGTDLLRFVGCLNPRDSFAAFNNENLVSLAKLYPDDFSDTDISLLDNQLNTYIIDVRNSSEFSNLDGIADLAKKMVQTKKHLTFPLVYLLITLALTLPVATASVERAFSAMNIVKNRLRSRMGDEFLNALLVTYIEKDVFDGIGNEVVMQHFQTMKSRREEL